MFCYSRCMPCLTRQLSIFLERFVWSRQCCCHRDWWHARNISIRISNNDILFEKEKRFYTISIREWVSEYPIRLNTIEFFLTIRASLVPVISFGENEHYRRSDNWITKRWIWGRSIIGFLPLRHPVMTIGKTRLSFSLDSIE